MRKILLLSTLLLSSCSISDHGGDPLVQRLPLPKQRQKVAFLEKKLERAEKEETRVKGEVETLSSALKEAQLAMIRTEVEEMESRVRKTDPLKRGDLIHVEVSKLFLKEREILYQMILSSPASTSYDAQIVLDSILEMITELSE